MLGQLGLGCWACQKGVSEQGGFPGGLVILAVSPSTRNDTPSTANGGLGVAVTMSRYSSIVIAVCMLAFSSSSHAADKNPTDTRFTPEQIEFFERKIRPLLVEHCHDCHGEDEQEGGLSLTHRASLLRGGDNGPALEPGHPEKSLLIEAIHYGPDSFQMPPDGKLPDEAIATLVKWVKIGAPWPAETAAPEDATSSESVLDRDLWAFHPLAEPSIPTVADTSWPSSPIDFFILARLEAEGLSPTKPTDCRTWIRRVTFDLVGLPPKPQDVRAFVNDASPEAFEKVVNRLLDSPHYGERWGRHWLDLVRFAETYGHEFDYDIPGAFRYRDYVIRAFNADVPYDQFLTEHIAGDMLQSPRRHPLEGFNESILGTAFFHFGEAKHSPVDIRGDEAERIDNQIDVLSKTFLGVTVACARCHDHKFDPIATEDYYALAGFLQSSRYQQAFIDDPAPNLAIIDEIQVLLDKRTAVARQLRQASEAGERNELTVIDASKSLRDDSLEAETQTYATFDGPDFEAWYVTGLAFGPAPNTPQAVIHGGRSISGWVEGGLADSGRYAEQLQGVLRSPTFTIQHPRVWYRLSGKGTINMVVDSHRLISGPLHGSLRLNVDQPSLFAWVSQDLTDYQSHKAYIEIIDDDNQSIIVDTVAFGGSKPPSDEREIHSELESSTVSNETPTIRTVDETSVANLQTTINELDSQIEDLRKQLRPSRRAPAMADGTPEDERVHIRGSHLRLGDVVSRRLLSVLAGNDQEPLNKDCGRLALAHRMLDAGRPLVARVMVNRLWQHHFARGLVATSDNFGQLGEEPTHPELLDYLAGRFISDGWSLKKLHRLMVLSSTYRMASRADATSDEQDPTNRFLHRMPIVRLEGEAIRDAMLSVSGSLNAEMFGPSIPPHLTPFMAGRGRPKKSGPLDGKGRRSIYINVRRNFLTPLLLAFDYPEPFTTIGRREASNVPAQALIMLNNPLVHSLSESWARRIVEGPIDDLDGRIVAMYERAFSRPPTSNELAAASEFVEERLKEYDGDELRAWRDFCHVTFNLKEFVFVR